MAIRGIIFDLDGTLVATEAASIKAVSQYFAKYHPESHKHINEAYVLEHFLPKRMGFKAILREMFGNDPDFIEQEYLKMIGLFFLQKNALQPVPGVEEFLEGNVPHLKIAIATNASRPYAQFLLGNCKELEPISKSVLMMTIDDQPKLAKPNPAMINILLSEMKCKPEEVVFVGDGGMGSDGGAALAAGVRFIGRHYAFQGGSISFDNTGELQECPHVAIIENMRELKKVIQNVNSQELVRQESVRAWRGGR